MNVDNIERGNNMLKIFSLLIASVAFSGTALAEAKVEIKSFISAGSRTNAAEVCGLVIGVSAPTVIVEVKVDGSGKNPGYYSVLVNRDGKFCVTVVTWDGTAEASLMSPSKWTLHSGVTRLGTKVDHDGHKH